LNAALFEDPLVHPLLKISARVFVKFGIDGYQRLVPGLALNLRGPCAKQVEAVVSLFLSTAPLCDVFLAFENAFSDPDVGVARNSLDFICLLVRGLTASVLNPMIDPLATALTAQLENKNPVIRKSAVFCFVDLKIAVRPALDSHLVTLKKP
jgi:hypothetical protein